MKKYEHHAFPNIQPIIFLELVNVYSQYLPCVDVNQSGETSQTGLAEG
jgi:hypothetical protein